MYKLFISHSSKDATLVESFVELLQMGMGFSRDEIFCTSLKGSLPTGKNFIEQIKKSVTDCTAVIFLISKSYIESSFCLSELGAAWALNQTIFPLLIDPITYNDIECTPLLGTQCLKLFCQKDLLQLGSEFLEKGISCFNLVDFSKYTDRFLSNHDVQVQSSIACSASINNKELGQYIEDLTLKSQSEDEARFLLGTMFWEGILVKQDKVKAKELLTLASLNDYAPAQYKLSSMYYKGDAGEQSFEKAFEWEQKAAEKGMDPWALDSLGFLYRAGLGCKQNLQEALRCYIKAVENGCNNSLSIIGEIYNILCDYENAAKWYSKAVDSGYSYAALWLGLLYKEGRGDMHPDYTQASYYLHIAAQAGITEAKYQLGQLYYMGHGVFKRDFKDACRWFKEAAEEGDIRSQYNLAYLYHHGLGVEYNWEKAVYWYEKAAQRGHQLSQVDLADLLAQSDRQQYEKAIYWYNTAANQNSCDAHRKLGDMYSFGIGCDIDQMLAIRHYKLAAEQGEKISSFRLKQSKC